MHFSLRGTLRCAVFMKKGIGFAVLVFPFAKSTLLSVTALYALYGLYLNLCQSWMVCLTEETHGYDAFEFLGECESGYHCWYRAEDTICFVSAMSCAFFLKINKKSALQQFLTQNIKWGQRGCWSVPEYSIDPSAGKRSPTNKGAVKTTDILSDIWRVFYFLGKAILSTAH